MSIIIGIDHGYYAIKTAHCSFPAGLTSYGEHEPYTRQGLLEFGGCFFVCGSGRQPIQRDKTVNDNYYLLTLAAIAKEIQQRALPPECSVRIAAGLPLTSFGRDKPKFKDYLLRSNQPVNYKFEGVEYSITIEEVAIFPQGYAALMTETGLLQDEPSMLLMDLGGWTVDLMRIDNAIPAADTAHSLELGMIRCVDDIREQVRRETGLSLTDAQIENMLAGQPCTVSDTVRDIVNKQGRKYTEHLLSATMEAGFDLYAMPMKVLIVEPGKYPREADIEHTLEAEQAVVGGTIEVVYPWRDSACIVCNDNGIAENLPLNRMLGDYDIIHGTFFVCGLTSNDFTDLTPQQMKRYEELYHDPQLFFLLGKTLCVEHTTPEEYSRVMTPPPNTKESHER